MRVLGRVLIWALVGFGAIGVIGMAWIVFKATNTGVVRPDRQLEDLLQEMGVAERVSIYITRNRYPIYEKTGSPDPNVPATHPLGSLADLFVASAAQHLHEEGILALDAPIGEVLPDLEAPLAALTPFQLLSHTAGLRDDRPGQQISEAGHTSFYASSGVALVARAIRAASGQTVTQIVTEVLVPAIGRWQEYDQEVDLTITDLTHQDGGDGTLVWTASARDLIRWELALNTGLLTRMKTHLRATRPAQLSDGSYGAFGMAWEISNYRGMRIEEIYARETTLGANLTRFSEKNFGIAILTDLPRSELDTRELARRIADFYLEREFPY